MEPNPASILVVEDRPGARYMTVQLMRRAGFHVDEAGTGLEGLEKVRSGRPDLVLLDVHLPDLNGREVAKRIKDDPELGTTLVVHLTGASIEPEDRVRGLYGGADAYLTRPIGDEELVANVRALIRLKRRAEDALAERDQFMSIAAHELRNPITALFLSFQRVLRMYKKGPVESERAIAVLETAEVQLKGLRDLVNELLDVSKLKGRRMLMEHERVDVGQLVQRLVERFEELGREAGCTLTYSAPEGPVLTSGDATRLEQIFTNLLTNAFKYGAGGPVRVAVWRDGVRVKVSVEDRGSGIPPEALARIFDAYERASDQSARDSLGLGLFIAREIALAHEGDIRVESREGEGSRFTVELPAIDGPR